MRLALIVALAMLAVPACKSSKQPEDVQQMKKKVPDAKPALHVAEDDPRYVASSGSATRQVHYYSVKMDTTYVVDESTGKVVTTYKSKQMPGVVVIDKPAYQPQPLKTEEGCAPAKEGCGEPAKEGCAEGCAPTAEGCGCGEKIETEEIETEEIETEEVEGCGEKAEGCGCDDDDAEARGEDDDDDEGEDEDDGCGEGCGR